MTVAFEVSLNNKVVCIAGVADYGVLTAVLSHVRRGPEAEYRPNSEELEFDVSGLTSASTSRPAEHLDWFKQNLSVGDDLRIRLVQVEKIDEPAVRKRVDPNREEKKERAYYERMKRKYEPDATR